MDPSHLWYWLEIHSGVAHGGPDPYYNFWSGFGSDIAEFAMLGGIVALVRHHNCNDKGCLRLARHVTKNGHRLCRKHVALPNELLNWPPIHEDHR